MVKHIYFANYRIIHAAVYKGLNCVSTNPSDWSKDADLSDIPDVRHIRDT